MAKKKTKAHKKTSKKFKIPELTLSKQQKNILGVFLFLFGILMCIAFVSYLFTWKADQSEIGHLSRHSKTENIANVFGASISHFFIYNGFGVASLIISFLISLSGITCLLDSKFELLKKRWLWGLLVTLWLSVFLGFFNSSILSGTIGFEMNDYLQGYLGKLGTGVLLFFFLLTYLITRFKITFDVVGEFFKKTKDTIQEDIEPEATGEPISNEISEEDLISEFVLEHNSKDLSTENSEETQEIQLNTEVNTTALDVEPPKEDIIIPSGNDGLAMEVEVMEEEKTITDNLSDKLVEDFGEFDPTLELSNFKFPTID